MGELLRFPMQQRFKMAVGGAEGLVLPQQFQPNLQPVPHSDEKLPDNIIPITSSSAPAHDIVSFPDTSYKRWKALKDEREARGEVKEREYGAFIQILVKDGDNISYRSLGLPRGTTPEMVQKMMKITLDPEATPKTFDDGKLAVLSRTDMDGEIDVADCMVEAAFQVIRDDHPDQNDSSVRKFYEKYPLIKKELRETGSRFGEYLKGSARARVADGRHVHHGSYMMEGETATGLDINGQPWDITTIARDPGHQDLMGEVVSIFKNNKKVVVFVGDTSGSVGECKEACSDYYEWREEGITNSPTRTRNEGNSGFTFTSHREATYTYTSGGEWGGPREDGCTQGHKKGKCDCNQAGEEASGGE